MEDVRNILALQGPMGNGKTTLVKEGISKILNRPFALVALGGCGDSGFLDGYDYTYEGSKYGKIIDIPYDKVFSSVKHINFNDSEFYEGYPNRDSLKYRSIYKLENVKTLKRGTLRHPGFCKTWNLSLIHI